MLHILNHSKHKKKLLHTKRVVLNVFKVLEANMATVVETWMGELAKLKEKVKVKTQKPLFSKAKEEAEEEKEGATKEARNVQTENMLSETTVCLLMERFAPW